MRLMFLVFFCCMGTAIAGAPQCGDIARRDIKDAFGNAKDVRFYYDVRPDLNDTCALLEVLEAWEETRTPDKAFKARKKEIISDIKSAIIAMETPLTVIRVWLRLKPENKKQRIMRIVAIRTSREKLEHYQAVLQEGRDRLIELMEV